MTKPKLHHRHHLILLISTIIIGISILATILAYKFIINKDPSFSNTDIKNTIYDFMNNIPSITTTSYINYLEGSLVEKEKLKYDYEKEKTTWQKCKTKVYENGGRWAMNAFRNMKNQATRYFVPMTIFMTPFMIEKKRFTNKEIFNKITPYFFIASLFASILGPVIVSMIGNRNTLLLETGMELVCYLIFYFMPERNFHLAKVTGQIHGIVTSFGSLTKGILLENMPANGTDSKMFRDHATIKKSCGVLSSWLGQDMKYATGTHQTNLLFSFITLLASFGIGVLVPDSADRKAKKNLFNLVFGGNMMGKMREVYTNEVLYYSILNVIGSTLYICFAMYSASIFIERKKDVDPSVFRLGKLLYTMSTPIRLLSRVVVGALSFLDSSIVYNPSYDKNTVIFGYIDGLAKLVAILSSLVLSFMFDPKYMLDIKCFSATVLVMLFTYLMGRTTSLMKSYLIFILGSVCSQIAFLWAYSGISVGKEDLHIILGLNLVTSSVIHITVSYYSKYMNYNVNRKMFLYFWMNAVLLGLALAVKIVDK